MRRLTLLVAVSAVIAGCSALGSAGFKQPVVNLRDVRLRGAGLTGGNLDVLLSVYNPNHYRLDATRLDYTLNLAGDSMTIANGSLDQHFTVNDNDSTTVTIPVSFTYAGLGAAGRSMLNTGAVNYHVLGKVAVGTPLGSMTVPFSSTGRFTATGPAR